MRQTTPPINTPASSDVPPITSKVRLLRGDRVLWIIIPILLLLSVLVVYSSVANLAYRTGASNGTVGDLFLTHLMHIAAGVVVLFVVYLLGSKIYYTFSLPAYLICLGLTILTYFVGQETNDAARSIKIGSFGLQPSELLKAATVLLLARQLDRKKDVIEKLKILPSFNPLKWIGKPALRKQWKIIKEGSFPILAPIVFSCGAVIYAHNSSALLIFAVGFLMLYIGRVHWRELLKLIVLVIAAGSLYIGLGIGRSSTALNRISGFVEDKPWAARVSELSDSDKAMIAIHDGGVTGMGAGRSVMRARLTHPESDYIFAVFIEEYGSIMAFVLLTMYMWIFLRAIHLFRRSEWLFGGLLVMGLATLVTAQAFLHVMVSLSLFPETGQNLPLISRGGSSMLCMGAIFGAILGVARQIENGTLLPPDRGESETGSTKL
ncbi:MAG: FtsW/RodA/SpoVE family cell cycle protein [Alistipes sp.]|nr:FtsW/RodA/SpoVE family cell cycle protein [Alistipes sp.]